MTTITTRRAIGNSIALKQGVPVTQASIDAMWASLAGRLNATLASSSTPSPGSVSRAPQSRAEGDAMWSSIAADLNKQAGLTPPARR
jgi:hypothetical protein